jgi:hypothetical protein
MSNLLQGASAAAVLQWLADENFNNDILRTLFRLNPDLGIVPKQDVVLTGRNAWRLRGNPINVHRWSCCRID